MSGERRNPDGTIDSWWRNSNQVSEANVTRYFPSSVLEPFGYTGIPSTRPHDLLYRRAKRLLEICQSKAERWLDMYVLSGRNPDWKDEQIRKYLMAELLHETDWLAVTVYCSNEYIRVYLDHIEYPITREFLTRR